MRSKLKNINLRSMERLKTIATSVLYVVLILFLIGVFLIGFGVILGIAAKVFMFGYNLIW